SSYGIDASTVDPRTIKIYNNGGKPLPEIPESSRPADLLENAIIVQGENDGKFDQQDYILFYGRGNNFWDYDTSSHTFKREFNVYTNHNYYWITAGGTNGKRALNESSLNQTGVYTQTSSKGFVSRDDEKINIGNSGRNFLGDVFTNLNTSETYTNKLDGRIDGIPIKYKLNFVTASSNATAIEVRENNTVIWNQYMSTGVSGYVDGTPYQSTVYFNNTLPDNRSVLKFTFTPNSGSAVGYLDYFEITYDKELKAFNDYLLFYSKDTTAAINYDLTNFSSSNIKVYDVTDFSGMKQVTDLNISGGECRFQLNQQQGNISTFIAVGGDNYKTPANPQAAENSNIHGIADGAKFIIITPKVFMDAANRLKNFRENESRNKLSTIVIDVEQIYNEFSGGLLDISAIRDFIKYAFNNWQIAPEYVLFFGSGNYDYKDILGYHTNFLPPYETTESLRELYTWTTDDFFVNLDSDKKTDLASGRITAKNIDQANQAVDKIIYYEQNSDRGPWRNLITLVADDGYQGAVYGGNDFTASSERLGNIYLPSSFDLNKLYMAAYPVVITGAGKRIPDGNKAILNAMNEGTLIINYVGHGAPDLWADEHIFEQGVTIPQLKNDRYFFVTAATCDFGYFDNPSSISAAEELVLDNNAGAIASLSSSRLVYQENNEQLMDAFFNALFNANNVALNGVCVGKALFNTKQTLFGENDQKYFLFGDPTLKLMVPEYSAKIDSVNGFSVATDSIQIKALSHIHLSGSIHNSDSTLWNDFNGEGLLSVFDSKRTELLSQLHNYQITRQGGLIFRGRVSVINGKFNPDFVVPKDISYQNQKGKIEFYFYDSNSDGLGYTNNIYVGGTDTTVVNDGKGPDIEIYFDNASAVNSYLVNPTSTMIIKLSDDTGLNTTGTGVGHQLEGILNDNEKNPIDFTKYFTGDLNAGGRSGEVSYKFDDLNQGSYSLKVNAWDVFNNFSSETVYFTVVDGSNLEIRDVYNYPNPFSDNTTFTFQRNQENPADVRIKIYTVAGRLIREIEANYITDKFVRVNWDGRDQDGDKIANGTYLYKIIVKNLDGTFSKSVLGKMAVIR
ncbi:MAG TPA: type IX secretion system sortase PorU, partial [Ignavibacteriaceae bacterium]|nr:type IX secretion system sortase PorU [Ignavibacteriaceae bacterium]